MKVEMLHENTAERCLQKRFEDGGTFLYSASSERLKQLDVNGHIPKDVVQFYYALEGEFSYAFGPSYKLKLKEGKYFFFFNPNQEMRFQVAAEGEFKWVAVYIPIHELHELFIGPQTDIPFLQSLSTDKKIYEENEYSLDIAVALKSLFNLSVDANTSKLFVRAKILEVLALHFGKREADVEACPFLRDEDNLLKIKKAKELLLKRMMDPPSIAELAQEVNISEYKLKSGFKEIYGDTIFGYLLQYKLNHAKELLDQGDVKVNEVAYDLGYTNPSHFITAFKKKFGVTPKKYLQSL